MDYLDAYASHLSLERGLSPNTVEGYTRDIRNLLDFIGDDLRIADCGEDEIHAFLASLHDIGLAQSSQARCVAAIRSFFHYLHSQGYIPADPAALIESPKAGRKLPDVLTLDEIEAMIAAIPPQKEESLRNHAIIEMLYGSGLRVSELCEMRISRYSASEGVVIIEGKGAKQRIVPVSEIAISSSPTIWSSACEAPSEPARRIYCFSTGGGAV